MIKIMEPAICQQTFRIFVQSKLLILITDLGTETM